MGASAVFMGFCLSAMSLTSLLSAPIYGRISDITRTTKSIVLISNLFAIAGNIIDLLIGFKTIKFRSENQRWSRGHKARDQGQGHKKKSEAKAKDSPTEDRPSRGQGLECSRSRPRMLEANARGQGQGPRGQGQVFSKKKVFKIFFSGDLQKRKTKKVFANFPRGFWRFPI